MGTQRLCEVLYEHVFSWAGLPESIVGDRDTRLRASELRALCTFLQVRLKLSVAYHPQTDGATEVFNKILLRALRSSVNVRHTDWVDILPALCYAYHNTVHTATGYTPHQLLMGWSPRDLRAPLASQASSEHPDVDAWLARRRDDFQCAHVSLERARSAMIAARNASAAAHVYRAGDLVKVSTRVLPVRCASTQLPKLHARWVGPFRVVEEVNPGALRLTLPDTYELTHNVFSVHDIRPWLNHESHVLDLDYPGVQMHPAVDRPVQILDRKRFGRPPQWLRNPRHDGHNLIDVPASYLVLHASGDTAWRRDNSFVTSSERELVRYFESQFKRTNEMPCNPVADYPEDWQTGGYESPDEVDFELERQLSEKWAD